MHPERVIVHTYRPSESLSTRLDDLNNLTHQSAATEKVPRDPTASRPRYMES